MTLDFGNEVRWIPVKTAAKMLGVSKQMVHKLINNDVLRSVVSDGTTLVSTASIHTRITTLTKKVGRKNHVG